MNDVLMMSLTTKNTYIIFTQTEEVKSAPCFSERLVFTVFWHQREIEMLGRVSGCGGVSSFTPPQGTT